MHKQLNRMIHHRVSQHLRANDIRLKEKRVVINRAGYVRLRRKMHNNIRFRNQLVDNVRMSDVAVKKSEMAVGFQAGRNIVQVAGIGQSIQQKDFGVRIALINIIDEITANKTRAASNQ